MKRTILLSLATAALAACSSALAPTRDASLQESVGSRIDTVSIPVGQSATVDGRLTLTFDARVADSRCPATAYCVWMGDANVRLTTRVSTGAPATAELHSGLEPRKLTVERYTISMVGLTPYPGTGRDAETPTVILRVTRD